MSRNRHDAIHQVDTQISKNLCSLILLLFVTDIMKLIAHTRVKKVFILRCVFKNMNMATSRTSEVVCQLAS